MVSAAGHSAPPADRRKAAWLAAAFLIALAGIGTTVGQAPAKTEAPPVVDLPTEVIVVSFLDRAPKSSASSMACLSGTRVLLCIIGDGAAAYTWQLGYEKKVLAQGQVTTKADGLGAVQIELPSIRHRILCELLVIRKEQQVLHRVPIYPRNVLSLCKQRLEKAAVGVADPSGRLQRALKDEGIAVKDLNPSTDSALDGFSGEIVVVSGFSDAVALNRALDRMEPLVQQGLSLLVLAPPSGWKRWGVTRIDTTDAMFSNVSVQSGFQRTISSEDLGFGPWTAWLTVPDDFTCSVTISSEVRGRDVSHRSIHALVGCGTVGQGRVVVVMLPEAAAADRSAAGRCVVDESILWLLWKQQEKETSS
ncbi:MAG TPA: hypothetical protein DCX07_02075 [Phycisphaerales bacterium]|nr:hypothetical protein [Phycisphaerales bacterium]